MGANHVQTYEQDDFDRDAREQSEARVMNISDEVIRFEIATQPGSKPRRYTLAPFGKTESSIRIQVGYTLPFKGAGRGMVRPTIESLTMREVISEIAPTQMHAGRTALRIPLVVHEDNAEAARAAYLAAMKRAAATGEGSMPTLVLHDAQTGRPMPVRVERKPAPVEDVEDQDGPLDEPPPDDDAPPAPVEIPEVAPPTTTRKGRA